VNNVRVVDDDTAFLSNPHLSQSDDWGLSLQWSGPFEGALSQLTAGVDGRRIDGSDRQRVFNAPDQLAAAILGEGVQTSAGLFAQASFRPSDRSEVLTGVRVDRFDNSDGRIVTNGIESSFADRDFDVVSPRIAARYEVAESVGLRAAVFGGFRAPTLAELYRSFETPTFRGLSNPELEEERLRGGDVGVDIRRGRVVAQLNGFYNRLENFVGSAEVGFIDGKFTVMATNVAEIRSRGVESMIAFRAWEHVTIDANYTFTDSEVVEGALSGNEVEGAPENVAALGATYSRAQTTVTLKGRYVDESFQDITNEAPQDSRLIVDLMALQEVHPRFDVFVAADNVFDEEYIGDGFGQSLGPPRQVSVGVRLDL
jgi:iron complex outermembrane receptor protein